MLSKHDRCWSRYCNPAATAQPDFRIDSEETASRLVRCPPDRLGWISHNVYYVNSNI